MRLLLFCFVLGLAGCRDRPDPPPAPITVFAAASLARPLDVLADAFTAQTRVEALRELGGSLEHVRKIGELGRVPDVLLLADDEAIASLVPGHLDWYVRFATSPIVIAFRDRSRHAGEITSENWPSILARSEVRIGRADSTIAPAGRHALVVLRRADAYYDEPGLTRRLMENASLRHVRPNATELAALLEVGEVDFILDYESVARQYGFRYVTLPRDFATSVLYGLSIPRAAANPRAALDFATLVLSESGKRILRDSYVTVLRVPVAVGTNVPDAITELVRTLADESSRQ